MIAEDVMTGAGPWGSVAPAPGYGRVARRDNIVWATGFVGHIDGGEVARGVEAQAFALFQRLGEKLSTVGACLCDVVELVSRHGDLSRLPEFASIKAEFFDDGCPAVWSPRAAERLAVPGALIEVDAVAVIPDGVDSLIPRARSAPQWQASQ